MTASITDLNARRAVDRAQRLLDGPRLTVVAGGSANAVGDVVPVPAELLGQLIALARKETP